MKTLSFGAVAAALVLPAAPAFAHPGHEGGGFAGGLLHPLTGADHVAAMVMIGLWAGLMAGRALLVLPAAFLTSMLAGFGYGWFAHAGAGVETAIILSVLCLGVAVALELRVPLALAGAVAGVFGFAHGMAHGIEMPGGQAVVPFVGGFLIATALLHGAGLLVARHVPPRWVRVAGLASAGFGLMLTGAV